MELKEYYVYQYLTKDGLPYYIGKGKGRRVHVDHKHIELPLIDQRVIIANGLTNTEAKELEGRLISEFKRKVDGGILDNIKINQWACFSGWKHSKEAKEKISKQNTGKVRSAEAKVNYSKPKTKEHAEKIRQANLGRPRDDRYEKISLTKSKQRWYNNGIITKMFEPGKETEGFVPGRKGISK